MAPTVGVTEDAPALTPVTEDAPALEPVTAGGETLSSIKKFPEEPAPATSAWLCAPASANPGVATGPRRRRGCSPAAAAENGGLRYGPLMK